MNQTKITFVTVIRLLSSNPSLSLQKNKKNNQTKYLYDFPFFFPKIFSMMEKIKQEPEEKEQKTGLWLDHIIVRNKWKSPILAPQFYSPPSVMPSECTIVMRFVANLERLNAKGKPYPDHTEDLDSEEELSDDEDIKDAKSSNTYEIFRDDILRGARPKHVKWRLIKILPNVDREVVPQSSYLTRKARYENDIEMQGDDGEIHYVDRIVPDGYNAGLYRQKDLTGTKFQFELSSENPFLIRNFYMDAMNAIDLYLNHQ